MSDKTDSSTSSSAKQAQKIRGDFPATVIERQSYIEVYPTGVRFVSPYSVVPHKLQKKNGDALPVRGKINGYSIASRMRNRHQIMTHNHVAKNEYYRVDITFPDPATNEEILLWWKKFGKHCEKYEDWFSAWWRKEIQPGRDRLHFHLLASVPVAAFVGSNLWRIKRMIFAEFDKHWPFVQYKNPVLLDGDRCWASAGPITEAPGAYEHALNIQFSEPSGAVLRYLVEHCTKEKRDQIPCGKGRHWGCINKTTGFVHVEPDRFFTVKRQYAIIRRLEERFRRARTPRRVNPYAARTRGFVDRLAKKRHIARIFSRDIFQDPALTMRFVEIALGGLSDKGRVEIGGLQGIA